MSKPIESEYTSQVAYTRALEEHCTMIESDLERTRVQLAGCGVAAMQNTEASKETRVKRGDYGWSESYGDVCRAVDREIALRADAKRLAYLTADLDTAHGRVKRNEILEQMSGMSYSAACMNIDAAMKGSS